VTWRLIVSELWAIASGFSSTLGLMKNLPYLLALLVVLFGALLLYLGELDDSPGLGGIGLILMVGAALLAVRHRMRTR